MTWVKNSDIMNHYLPKKTLPVMLPLPGKIAPPTIVSINTVIKSIKISITIGCISYGVLLQCKLKYTISVIKIINLCKPFIERHSGMAEETKDSRREVLKKVGRAAVFVVPTIVTFQTANLAVAASGEVTTGFGKMSVRATMENY